MFKKAVYKCVFVLARLWIRLLDLPHELAYQFQILRYGGKDKVPKRIQEAYCKYHVSKMDLSEGAVNDLLFMGSMGALLKVYKLEPANSHLTCAIVNTMHGVLPDETTAKLIESIRNAEFPMRALQMALIEEGVIRQQQVVFRLTNDRETLEPLLSWSPSKATVA